MNLEQAELLTLEEFLSRFNNNDLTIEQFLLGAKRYPAFHAALEGRLTTLPTVSNPEEARLQLLEIIEQYRVFPEQVRRESPTSITPIRELQHHAEILHEATTKTQQAHKSSLEELQKTYPKRLFDNFLAQTKKQLGEATVADALNKTEGVQPPRRRIDQTLTSLGMATKEKQRIIADAERVTTAEIQSDPSLAAPSRLAATLDMTASLLIENPRTKADAAFTIARELAQTSPTLTPAKVAEGAFAHTTMLEALASGVEDTRGAGTRVFYQVYAKGAQKVVAPVGDFLLRLMPQEWRVEVIEDQIAKSFVRVADEMERAGQGVVDSPVFKQYFDQARQHQQLASSTTGFQKARNAVADLMGFVFGDTDPVARAVYKNGQVLWKSMDIPFESASLLRVHYAELAAKMPGLFSLFAKEGGRQTLHFAAERAAGEGAKRLAGTALGKFLGGLFGSAGGPIGAIAGSLLLDKVLGFVGGAVKGIFNFLSGDVFARMLSGDIKADWRKDMPLLVALGAVVVVAIFAFSGLFSAFLPGLGIFQLASDTPLAINMRGAVSDDEPGVTAGTVPACDPLHQDCRWPTPCGCVTQGPYFQGTDSTHRVVNAIDIGFSSRVCSAYRRSHVPITATQEGVVLDVFYGLADGDKSFAQRGRILGVNYGNYVIVQTASGMQVIYAHVSRTGPRLSAGQRVNVGDEIALTDDNGSSQFEHLHYEIRNGPPIRSLLPSFVVGQTCWSRPGPATPRSNITCENGATILPIGDSITYGYLTPPGYRGFLTNRLRDARLGAELLPPLAYGNTQPGDMVGRVRSALRSMTTKPDIILLHAGTVRIKSEYNDNITGIEALVGAIVNEAPQATVYVAQIVMRYDLNEEDRHFVSDFNAFVGGLAGRYPIRVVPMEGLLGPSDMLPTDGVHPIPDTDNVGYDKMAAAWAGAVSGTLPRCDGGQ